MKYPFFNEPRLVFLVLIRSNEIIRCKIIAHGLEEAVKNASTYYGEVSLNGWISSTLPGDDNNVLFGGGKFIPSKWNSKYPKAIKAIKD